MRYYVYGEFHYHNDELFMWDREDDSDTESLTKMINNDNTDDGSFEVENIENASVAAIIYLANKYMNYYKPIGIKSTSSHIDIFIDNLDMSALSVDIVDIEEKI